MVILVFGDVHGNIIALEKLFKLEKSSTDLFISHGDIVNYGPWSNECVQYLNDIFNCRIAKGNHEQFYLQSKYIGNNIIAKTFFDFCFSKFDKKLLEVINLYTEKIVVDDFTIQHTINGQYIFSDTDISNFEFDTNYVIGHSHQQFKKIIGKNYLINTGSIGQNRQYLNQSCYVKINTETKRVELKTFLFDIQKQINHMKSINYPDICLDYYISKKTLPT